MSAGQKILDGLKDAVAGNFARVVIEGQTWARIDPAPAGYRTIPIAQIEAYDAAAKALPVVERFLGALTDDGAEEYHVVYTALAALRAAGIDTEDKT